MANKIARNSIINTFYRFNDSSNIKALQKFSERIKAYLATCEEPDIELEYIVLALKAIAEDARTDSFTVCSAIVAPIFEGLKDKKYIIYLESTILGMVLHFAPTYNIAITLAQRAVDTIDKNYKNELNHRNVLNMIYINITYRLLRAKYIDVQNTAKQKTEMKEIETHFTYYLNAANEMSDELKHTAAKLFLAVRKAAFEEDCDGIQAGFEMLKKAGEKELLKAAQNDVVEYVKRIKHNNIPTPLLNFLTGYMMRKRRKELDISSSELADLLDVNQQQITDYESGKKGIGGPRLCTLANILGVTTGYFYGDADVIDASGDDPETKEMNDIMRRAKAPKRAFMLSFAKLYMKHVDNENDDE